jgi:hypothetical protein
MHNRSIVPYHNIANAPFVAIGKIGLVQPGDEGVQGNLCLAAASVANLSDVVRPLIFDYEAHHSTAAALFVSNRNPE